MAKPTKTYYSDLNLTFKAHPVTGKVGILKNAEAVKRAVRNLIMTNWYEKPYQPNYGGNLITKLFENADFFTAVDIHDAIKEAIDNHEPRADVIDIVVDMDYDRNSVFVKIVFRILNQLEPVELDLYLERVR